MSTHVLDASGQRALNLSLNDPARTAATLNAKAGDDVKFQLGSAQEVRIGLPLNARIERRLYVTRSQVVKEGRAQKDPETGEFLFEERPYESLYLVFSGGVTVFARNSRSEEEKAALEAEDKPTYENTPHTTVYVKRLGDEKDFSESGTLLEDRELAEFLPRLEEDAVKLAYETVKASS